MNSTVMSAEHLQVPLGTSTTSITTRMAVTGSERHLAEMAQPPQSRRAEPLPTLTPQNR